MLPPRYLPTPQQADRIGSKKVAEQQEMLGVVELDAGSPCPDLETVDPLEVAVKGHNGWSGPQLLREESCNRRVQGIERVQRSEDSFIDGPLQ